MQDNFQHSSGFQMGDFVQHVSDSWMGVGMVCCVWDAPDGTAWVSVVWNDSFKMDVKASQISHVK